MACRSFFCLHLWTIAFSRFPRLQPRRLSPLSPLGHVGWAQPETTLGWMSERELQSSGRGGGWDGGGGSFSVGPWRRAVSEPLLFRRGQKSLGSGKEALQAAPTASALHLLHPPSSPHGFLRQVQHAETPSPSVPCSSSPGLQAAQPAGNCSPSLLRALGLGWEGDA